MNRVSTLMARRSLIAHLAPASPASDRYRSLRAMIDGMKNVPDCKVITIASSLPSEGKTTTAVNLAIAIAQSGRSVLLVDGSLRAPALHDIFSESNLIGLSQVLAGTATMEEAVREVGISNLSVITAGLRPSDSSDLLGSLRLKGFMLQTKKSYDHIIMDSPALLSRTDASALAAESDGVLFIVNAKRSTKAASREGLQMLDRLDARVVGSVLTQARGSWRSKGF